MTNFNSDHSSFPLRQLPARWRVIGSSVLLGCLIAPAVQASEPQKAESIWGEKTELTIGAGVGAMPRYWGSSETRIVPIPVVAVQRGAFFADIVRGIGAEYQTNSGLYFSTSLGYDMGRTNRDSTWEPGSKRLEGMGVVKGSTTFNVLVAQPITSWLSVNGEAEFRMGGQRDRGNQYRLGLHSDLIDNDKDTLSLDLSAHAGDAKYNRTYFSVTPQQSASSRFAAYTADSGVYAYSLTGSWSHTFTPHYSLVTAVVVTRLTGDAGRSPLVQERTGVTGVASLNYTF